MKCLTARIVSLALTVLVPLGSRAQTPVEPPAVPSSRVETPVVPQNLPDTKEETTDESDTGEEAAVSDQGKLVPLNPSEPRIFEFQADEIGLVIRTLARMAMLNVVISDRVSSTAGAVTMRFEGKTPKEAIDIIVQSKGLVMDEINGVYFIKTQEEYARRPTSVLLGDLTEQLVPPMARLKGEYYRSLVASGVPEATASTIVLNEKVSESTLAPREATPAQASAATAIQAASSKASEWLTWAIVGSAIGLEAFQRLPLILLHFVFAVAVWLDARRNRRAEIELVYFGPFIWAIATLFGGIFIAAFYWIAHHSTLRRTHGEN